MKPKQSMWILLCCILPALACSQKNDPAAPVAGTTGIYYVAVNGNNTNHGTLAAPLKTIGNALNRAKPGDTVIVRGGTYYEKVVFPRSGEKNRFITLKAYDGERPVINGGGLTVEGEEGLVTLNGVSWIIMEGFDVCHFKSATPSGRPDGIQVKGAGGHIILRRNRVFDIASEIAPEEGRSAHAILIIGNTREPLTHILVEENEIHDCKTGYSENLTINGYVDSFMIRNNTIYNGENIGIDAAGGYAANPNPALNYVRNGVISGNEVYNIAFTNGPIRSGGDYGAIAIYVDGARNITVENNKVHDSDRGIGIVSENNDFPTEDCIVRNNFIYSCSLTGIYLGGYLGYTTGGTDHCYIINNTLYKNDKVPGAFGEVEGEIRLTENCNNNTIKNNIIYAREINDVFIHKYTATGAGNVINNNLYYAGGSGKWIWNGVEYTDFNAWRTACGGDAASTAGSDPQFENTSVPDLHIKSASPANNTGQVISMAINGETDIDGDPRIINNRISKGADQPR